ncbi:hypothetical protein BDK51DRAFT_29136 [Blyttiomyces helicus]|uniref:Uncharacterized protein n=1 Tax=Blyttiomyces helicus TaxID=388810 RepID=A0A4P9W0X1_9FUNG|nr:hypothetical protein BDK51DRAFT_29136 [Blyttiomyces helicus]|eukprot:RKO85811.1 hypothetical protein BDK51DRAFT_29136 [Blyttiomyces helicus]
MTCSLSLALQYPTPRQFIITSVTHTGDLSLPFGSDANTGSSYFLNGVLNENVSTRTDFVGPIDLLAYQVQDVFEGPQWSACGTQEIVTIQHEVLVNGDGDGFVAVAKGKDYNFQWRNC